MAKKRGSSSTQSGSSQNLADRAHSLVLETFGSGASNTLLVQSRTLLVTEQMYCLPEGALSSRYRCSVHC
jgi:hypothetical protein